MNKILEPKKYRNAENFRVSKIFTIVFQLSIFFTTAMLPSVTH